MNTLTAIIGTLIISAGIFTLGYSQGKQSVKVEQFEAYVTLQKRVTTLDTDLLRAQSVQAESRDKEVIKYVTVYRDRIKDPVIDNAVRDSGLLAVYDASVSTASQ